MCGLRDVGFQECPFTWTNGREGERVCSWLDICVSTTEWMTLFPWATVTHEECGVYDHCPVLLSLPKNSTEKKGVTNFEAMCNKDKRCEEIINEAWDEGDYILETLKLLAKIQRCRDRLARWNTHTFGQLRRRIREQKSHMNSLNEWGNSYEIKQDIKELNDLLEMEEIMWRQRSRVSWLKDDDKNTKKIHSRVPKEGA
ncbi:hypothetical protein CFOL_v3_30547 [Cephalotus follicularis]|uniref:Exo_endo_phos domain-containing protein n=1 Tax=Cephalotus follicularis TaxID=3775 RepID=A0A1Q3D3Z2_CEPFO|nr:hypothetical protein CFOL_v3_30547 [Cephalotus follicularis]